MEGERKNEWTNEAKQKQNKKWVPRDGRLKQK